MTLVQLRHLIALADQASFSKAALAANLSQPALSRSIRALEDELRLAAGRSHRPPRRTHGARSRHARTRAPDRLRRRRAACARPACQGPCRWNAAHRHGLGSGRDADDGAAAKGVRGSRAAAPSHHAQRHRLARALTARQGARRPRRRCALAETRTRLARRVRARDARRLHGATRPPAGTPPPRARASTRCASTRSPRRPSPTKWRACSSSATAHRHTRMLASRCAATSCRASSSWRGAATPCCWPSAPRRPIWWS